MKAKRTRCCLVENCRAKARSIHATGIKQKSLKIKSVPTKRAADVWDSARFRGFLLASGFSRSQTESTPAHTQVTQTVGRLIYHRFMS